MLTSIAAFLRQPAVVKALAVLACSGLYVWKGVELDPDELLEVFASGLAVSQLVRRVGDAAPPQGPKAPTRNVWGP